MIPAKGRKINSTTNIVPSWDRRFAAWWYGQVIPNKAQGYQPNINILFREVDEKGSLLTATCMHAVNVAMLGQVPLGSVWHKGRKVNELGLENKTFRVDFSQYGWEALPSLHKTDDRHYLIPPYSHPLLVGFTKSDVDSWVLRFKLPEGKWLAVPAIAYFLRAYGLSGEIHRILLTYPWPEASRRLFGKHQSSITESPKNEWVVHPGAYMQNEDAYFLAHLLHDQNAQRLAKLLWSQLARRRPTHLAVEPWHGNTGEIEVVGKTLPNGGFLGLQITGLELPRCPPIKVLRVRKEKAPGAKTRDGDIIPVPHKVAAFQDMPLDDNEPPDHGKGHFEVEDSSSFRILGQEPEMEIAHLDETQTQRQGVAVKEPVDRLSAGDAAGAPKGVGKVVSRTPVIVESMGVLWDMWNTFKMLRDRHPERIQDLGWMTWDGAIGRDSLPQLCPFPAGTANRSHTTWLTLDKESGLQRGLLLIWVRTNVCDVIVLEIQRRKDPGKQGEAERFQGLAVRVEDDLEGVLRWLRMAASAAAENKGVFSKGILRSCPTVAETFKHVPAKGTTLRENTAWLALNKAGC